MIESWYGRGRDMLGTRFAPVEAAFRMHSLQTWLLWLVGAVVMGFLFRWDPALMVYLMEPEFVAGWILFAVHYATLWPRYVWGLLQTGWRSAVWWHEVTCEYVVLRTRQVVAEHGVVRG
jgi:hypothetical protein